MARLEYFMVAESISIDVNTNRVSIFNVIEDVRCTSFPQVIAQIAAIVSWNREDGDEDQDFQAQLNIRGPMGRGPFELLCNFRFERSLRMRNQFVLNGIPLISEGELQVEICLNGQHQASHTIMIHQTPRD